VPQRDPEANDVEELTWTSEAEEDLLETYSFIGSHPQTVRTLQAERGLTANGRVPVVGTETGGGKIAYCSFFL
jgi:hypothetical protein